LKRIIDLLAEPILVIDENLRFVDANRSFFESLNKSRNKIKEQHLDETFADDLDELKTLKSLISGTSKDCILKFNALFWFCTIRQVTESGKKFFLVRFQQWESSFEFNKFQSSILESVGDAVIVTDISGEIIYWNQAATKIFGIEREEIIAKPITKFNPDFKMEFYQEYFKDHDYYQLDWNFTGNNQNKWVDVKLTPLKNNDSVEIIGILGISKDITERKLTEIRMKQTLDRLNLATKSARLGVWEYDIATNRLYWNEQLYEIYGISDDKLKMESWESQVLTEDLPGAQAELNKVLEEGKEVLNVQFRIRRPDGEVRYVNASAAPQFNEDNTAIIKMIGVNVDVTDLVETQHSLQVNHQELQKANQDLDHFVYSTSHNLRAPLASILGLTEILEFSRDLEEVNTYIGLIKKSIHKLDETIHEITDYFKNSRLEIEKTRIHLEEMIREIYFELSFMEHAKNIEVYIEIEEICPFYSDSNRLKVVFHNLISNAIKYSNPQEKNSYIAINGKVDHENAHLTIKDNGLGIKPEHMVRIFEMFYRAHQQATGSGLGLYIVKEVMDKLNGQISANSNSTGITTFELEFPNHIQN